ncbi:hypothetical protein [Gorillibacterium sp. CAU 1737]|uniref:HAAS signaling domain-containing protein n=1 Tax=Gorillibacterium sp. CAU 1737 TaxID=3140362 RepID=UPI0032608CF8
MEKWIDRYVYDVVRQLPEKDRDDVSRELKSNIYDMLSDHPDEEEVKAVLVELGSPSLLAEKYRQKPRYLISPAYYESYVRTLKMILPLVGGIALVAGLILGALDTMKEDQVQVISLTGDMVSTGISLAFQAAFQALLWTTIGFVIADRTKDKAESGKTEEWKIEDLPEVPAHDRGKIPLSEGIAEMVMTIVFTFFALLICSGKIPFLISLNNGDTKISNLFNPAFLHYFIPPILGMALLGLIASACKIKYRRWTPVVCGTVVISSLISMVIMIYLLNSPDILSSESIAYFNSVDWEELSTLRLWGMSGGRSILALISILVAIGYLVESGKAIYKTMKAKRQA